MQLGLAVDLSSTEPVRAQVDGVVALLGHAEERGITSAWVGESYHDSPQAFHLPANLMVLAHLAGRTSLHLGTAVLLLRAYAPERLAYEVALLDQLCEGRFTLGLGLGSQDVARRTGMPAATPAGAAFDAALRLLRHAWDPPSAGTNPRPHVAVPGPVQAGGPRILVGGRTTASVRRAAALADGYYGATNYTDELLLDQAAAYWELRGGQRPESSGEVATTRLCLVHDDPSTARALAERYFGPVVDYYTSRHAWIGRCGPSEVELPLVGSPDDVLDAIDRYRQAGVTSVQLRVAPQGIPPEVARRSIDLVGSDVLPALTDGGA
jgi:alkanesulfonate monooxygenase SsuD/methylene tetrahydromethanopterin reductase-like flavin-dependent oxidoreductase (luciferase family)